ncbi:TetR/AcrR family transcriptional regulator [Anaerosalibacter massiliensis]|uniref:TetR/AcrR family transcriptional regulator n=1 Tax=Anaerosalibacter massiliensis TaxID=1347392 RepID=A0A9X2ME96_9FIRM|nr:TetR/AcrR family transcriptional regulator [Anaerosalibacter massiliensis]
MARNKYPEETIERILDVSLELFIQKGYENTSIQDIVNNLGGLSKDAIYHHFKSKEEILEAVSKRIYSSTKTSMLSIINSRELTGLKKLRKIFKYSIENSNQDLMFPDSPKLWDNPNLLVMQMKELMEDIVPNYMQPIIEQGLQDGSIKTDYPKELAEVIILLFNIWINPLVYDVPVEELINKIKFCDILFKGMGIDILNENMCEKIIKLKTLSTR